MTLSFLPVKPRRLSWANAVAIVSFFSYAALMAGTHQVAYQRYAAIARIENPVNLPKDCPLQETPSAPPPAVVVPNAAGAIAPKEATVEPAAKVNRCYRVKLEVTLLKAFTYLYPFESANAETCKLPELPTNPEERKTRLTALLDQNEKCRVNEKVQWRMPNRGSSTSIGHATEYQKLMKEQLWWFRVKSVMQYLTANLATLCQILAALFLLWSSKPHLNVLASLVLLTLGLLFAICTILFNFLIFSQEPSLTSTNEKVTMCDALSQFVARVVQKDFGSVKYPRPTITDCETKKSSHGGQLWKLWLGVALSAISLALAIIRIRLYQLPFFSRNVDQVAHLRKPVHEDAASEPSTARTNNIRRRVPLL